MQVTIHGNISKDNFKKDVSKDVKIIERPNTNDLNPENVIRFEMKVPANETKQFEFSYDVKNWELREGTGFGSAGGLFGPGPPSSNISFGKHSAL